MNLNLKKIFDGKEFALNLNGKFGIPELTELIDFLKDEKAKSIETEIKRGDLVYVDGYRDYYGIGEVLEVRVEIWHDGNPHIYCVVDGIGERYESELRKV